ncbi:MAG: ATP-binding protein [Myxococcota bacterium]|nr:ATP-binding protein [Myxococcota bacterium]
MFRTNTPVTAGSFRDRVDELALLEEAVDSLKSGAPKWVALIGMRKVGKTSLLLELERRKSTADVHFVVLDSYEERPLSLSIFRRYLLRTIDGFFSKQSGVSFEAVSKDPLHYRSALMGNDSFIGLPGPLRSTLLALVEGKVDRSFIENALRLPEQLAIALNRTCIVAWDEFQELSSFATRAKIDVLSLARSIWQRHERVGYLISGSKRTMMEELVLGKASPFFQHFSILDVGGMPESESVALLKECAPKGRTIPKALAKRAAALFFGHPFYLQLFGETLTRLTPPYNDDDFKDAFSELVFSRTGRLSLYFQREYEHLVGRASSLAATLGALSEGPRAPGEVAKVIGASSGSTSRYLERLGDTIRRTPDGKYEIVDSVFALWLSWRQPGGTVVPLTVVGNEAELAVARALAQMGFELVYQSRASRGAFDLLGIRAGIQLGIQVKRSAVPLRFSKGDWHRMRNDARRFGWQYVIAAVDPDDNRVAFLDPLGAESKKSITLTRKAQIENLLRWMSSS